MSAFRFCFPFGKGSNPQGLVGGMHKSETRRFNPFGLCGVISYHNTRKREQ